MYRINYKLIFLIIFFCLFATNKSFVLYCFAATETTKERAGFKLEGAVFHDELWEKYRVIAPEGGGANGEAVEQVVQMQIVQVILGLTIHQVELWEVQQVGGLLEVRLQIR